MAVHNKPALTVGQLAHASRVAPSAVRFYEEQGLISAERTSGNQRRFRRSDACRIKVIRVAQRIGLTVNEIRHRLDDLPVTPEPTSEDWRRLNQRLVRDAHRRIEQLTGVLADLTSDQQLCDLPPSDHRDFTELVTS
jgi:MerR family redox-sensitive transcriptional activator SoxR